MRRLHQIAPISTNLRQTASSCTNLHQIGPICSNLHQIAPICTNLHQTGTKLHQSAAPNCSKLHQSAPSCIKLHQSSLRCTKVHRVAPICTKLHQSALSSLREISNLVEFTGAPYSMALSKSLRVVFFVYGDAIHVRCSASGFCIISNFCVKSVLMSVR